jgi:hypothetical protein
MRFENALINTAAAVEISKLDELTKARIKDMFSYIAKIDPDLVLDDKHSNLSNYLTLCNDVIEKAIPNIKAPFIAGAKQNLGFYSTEEEADEVGMELAARIGISGLRGPGLFQKFNSEILKSDPYEDPRATPYSECSDLRRSGWVKDGKSASSVLLIDSLSNIHHGLCYREFNSYREWKEHNLDRLHNKDFSFAFDDKAWKEAVATIPVLQPATKSDSSSNSLRNRKNTIHEKPFCVFSPYKVELN